MITAMILCFSAYVIAHMAAIIYLRRGWRWASLVPVLPMIFVVAATIKFFIKQGNLWPLLLLFSSPVALAHMLCVWAVHRLLRS